MNQWTADRIELSFRSFAVPKDFGTSEVPPIFIGAKSAKIQFHPVISIESIRIGNDKNPQAIHNRRAVGC